MTAMMSSPLEIIKSVIEERTGKTPEDIQQMGICEWREYIEKLTGNPLRLIKEFPVIGRGNVLRDSILTREEINKSLDEALKR